MTEKERIAEAILDWPIIADREVAKRKILEILDAKDSRPCPNCAVKDAALIDVLEVCQDCECDIVNDVPVTCLKCIAQAALSPSPLPWEELLRVAIKFYNYGTHGKKCYLNLKEHEFDKKGFSEQLKISASQGDRIKSLESELSTMREALEWVTHLINGVSKDGSSQISSEEWEECNKSCQQALAPKEKERENG